MAPHSSTFAWRVPWTEEPGGLQSMGSLRVRHNWATSLSPFTFMHWKGNGNLLQCSCLENPRDGGAWWAAVYGVTQSWTRLKQWLSSSSSSRVPLLEKRQRGKKLNCIPFFLCARCYATYSWTFNSPNKSVVLYPFYRWRKGNLSKSAPSNVDWFLPEVHIPFNKICYYKEQWKPALWFFLFSSIHMHMHYRKPTEVFKYKTNHLLLAKPNLVWKTLAQTPKPS